MKTLFVYVNIIDIARMSNDRRMTKDQKETGINNRLSDCLIDKKIEIL